MTETRPKLAWRSRRRNFSLGALALWSVVACNRDTSYECIERTQKDVPNFQAEGTHTEVDYVLLHEGHKIYASCDVYDLDKLDPTATCGFRPLRKYKCAIQSDSMEKATSVLSDLKCKDGDGHNVYLYVSKKE
jgi:hypothetical protein